VEGGGGGGGEGGREGDLSHTKYSSNLYVPYDYQLNKRRRG